MKDFLDNLGVGFTDIADLKEGQAYPFYGFITAISENSDGIVSEIVINHNMKAKVNLSSEDSERANKFSSLLKERSLEPGIFMATFCGRDGDFLILQCNTVIFGKRQEEPVQ